MVACAVNLAAVWRVSVPLRTAVYWDCSCKVQYITAASIGGSGHGIMDVCA